MHRVILPVVLVVLVALSGCAVPAVDYDGAATGDDETPRETTTEDAGSAAGLDVVGGTLSFDANRTYERVQAMLDAEFAPPVVYVDEPVGAPQVDREPASFYAVMGVPQPDPSDATADLGVGGVASQFRAVYVRPDANASPGQVEATLVHELVHAAQFQHGVPGAVRDAIPAVHRGTTDARMASRSVVEGSAVYGSSAYTRRHDAPVEPEGAVIERLYPDAGTGTKLSWGPYYHGYRYVEARADGPANHWRVYEEPPVTMHEVVHGAGSADGADENGTANGSGDGLEPFDADLRTGDGWTESRRDTLGAFVVRQVLATELSDAESATAAAGWEYDRLVGVSGDDRPLDGYTWTLRFADADEAATAEDALAAYLGDRADAATVNGSPVDPTAVAPADRTRARWTSERYAFEIDTVDERTVAVVAGSPTAVDRTSVASGPGADVRVVVDENGVRTGDAAEAVAAPVAG